MIEKEVQLRRDLRKKLEDKAMVVKDLRDNTMMALSLNTVMDLLLRDDEDIDSIITTIKLIEERNVWKLLFRRILGSN